MSYRSTAAEFARISRQTKEFRAILANGRHLERLCGENLADARREAERLAKRDKTTVVSLEAK